MDCATVCVTHHPLFAACSSSSRYSPASSISYSSRRQRREQVCVSQREEVVPEESSAAKSTTSFLALLCPLLKLFSGGNPSRQRNFFVEDATSSLSTLARYPWGSAVKITPLADKAPLPLQLYEFEACPFCRRVREAMTELDLSAEVYPCPKGSKRHRSIVQKMGGKEQFPFLVDPNTGTSMYESGDIVNYLFAQYGEKNPSTGLLESTLITGWVPTILRAGRGMTLWESAKSSEPSMLLELYSYENNPKSRIVREALCELELPYMLQNVGKGSVRETLLLQAAGSVDVKSLQPFKLITDPFPSTIKHKSFSNCGTFFDWISNHLVRSSSNICRDNVLHLFVYLLHSDNINLCVCVQVPYLIDPNTGTQLGSYKRILSYLFNTYSNAHIPILP